MGTSYHTMTALVDADPEAMAQFVLRQWQLSRGMATQEMEIQSIEQLNTEFQVTKGVSQNARFFQGLTSLPMDDRRCP